MNKLNQLVQDVINVSGIDNPNRVEDSYLPVVALAKFLFEENYGDMEDSNNIAGTVAGIVATNMITDPQWVVTYWKSYIRILIRQVLREDFGNHYIELEHADPISVEELIESKNPFASDSLIFNPEIFTIWIDAVEKSYKKVMKVFDTLIIYNEEESNIIQRIILLSLLDNRGVINCFSNNKLSLIKCVASRVKFIIDEYKELGLLIK